MLIRACGHIPTMFLSCFAEGIKQNCRFLNFPLMTHSPEESPPLRRTRRPRRLSVVSTCLSLSDSNTSERDLCCINGPIRAALCSPSHCVPIGPVGGSGWGLSSCVCQRLNAVNCFTTSRRWCGLRWCLQSYSELVSARRSV